MYKACRCILLASLGLSGQTIGQTFDYFDSSARVAAPADPQTVAKLHSTLLALKSARAPGDSLSRQLTDNMVALMMSDRQPARPEIAGFTGEFTRALAGKALSNDQAATLEQCLVDILRRAGISNYALARRLRETLTALRVDDAKTDLITRRYLAIGEAVRGPDDAPVRPKIEVK